MASSLIELRSAADELYKLCAVPTAASKDPKPSKFFDCGLEPETDDEPSPVASSSKLSSSEAGQLLRDLCPAACAPSGIRGLQAFPFLISLGSMEADCIFASLGGARLSYSADAVQQLQLELEAEAAAPIQTDEVSAKRHAAAAKWSTAPVFLCSSANSEGMAEDGTTELFRCPLTNVIQPCLPVPATGSRIPKDPGAFRVTIPTEAEQLIDRRLVEEQSIARQIEIAAVTRFTAYAQEYYSSAAVTTGVDRRSDCVASVFVTDRTIESSNAHAGSKVPSLVVQVDVQFLHRVFAEGAEPNDSPVLEWRAGHSFLVDFNNDAVRIAQNSRAIVTRIDRARPEDERQAPPFVLAAGHSASSRHAVERKQNENVVSVHNDSDLTQTVTNVSFGEATLASLGATTSSEGGVSRGSAVDVALWAMGSMVQDVEIQHFHGIVREAMLPPAAARLQQLAPRIDPSEVAEEGAEPAAAASPDASPARARGDQVSIVMELAEFAKNRQRDNPVTIGSFDENAFLEHIGESMDLDATLA